MAEILPLKSSRGRAASKVGSLPRPQLPALLGVERCLSPGCSVRQGRNKVAAGSHVPVESSTGTRFESWPAGTQTGPKTPRASALFHVCYQSLCNFWLWTVYLESQTRYSNCNGTRGTSPGRSKKARRMSTATSPPAQLTASEVYSKISAMERGQRKTINGAKVYLPRSGGGFMVTIAEVTEHYGNPTDASHAILEGAHPARATVTPIRRRGCIRTGDPRADRAARDEQIGRAIDNAIADSNARQATRRTAKQDLATRVAIALGALLSDLEGSAALEGMTLEEAGQTLANWIHHLPVDRSAWPASLPRPDRSNWR